MKSCSASLFLVLLLPVLAAAAAAAAAQKENLLGGWKPIADVKDPHVQEIGKFAVTENNAESKGSLVFEDVVSGESQVVSGINYRLVITVKDGNTDAEYEAVVWEKTWENFKHLTSFKLLA